MAYAYCRSCEDERRVTNKAIDDAINAAVKHEREMCAKIAANFDPWKVQAPQIAAAIRARTQAGQYRGRGK